MKNALIIEIVESGRFCLVRVSVTLHSSRIITRAFGFALANACLYNMWDEDIKGETDAGVLGEVAEGEDCGLGGEVPVEGTFARGCFLYEGLDQLSALLAAKLEE